MSPRIIGIAVYRPSNAPVTIDVMEKADKMGISAAWLTTSGAGLDALTIFAAAAQRTSRIMLGTAITPTFPRHPLAVAQQVQVVAQLAPGRFRLGLGPSHRPTMREIFGVEFHDPLGHLTEYVRIVRTLLRDGSVDYDGRYYTAHAQIGAPVDVPVMASALRAGAFRLCGAEADGAISWVCPAPYLEDVALPALKQGAEMAGRPVPPLIAHAPVCAHENLDEVREAVRDQIRNPRLPYYQRMFAAAGFPEAANGTWSDAMIDATVVWGDESRVAEGIERLFSLGAAEVLATPVLAGNDKEASLDRTLRVLAGLSG